MTRANDTDFPCLCPDTILLKGRHTRVQCEEQAHTSIYEGRHTRVPAKEGIHVYM